MPLIAQRLGQKRVNAKRSVQNLAVDRDQNVFQLHDIPHALKDVRSPLSATRKICLHDLQSQRPTLNNNHLPVIAFRALPTQRFPR